MILVADSSALVILSIVDKLNVLESLFDDVCIPKAVYDEVTVDYKIESKRLKDFCEGKVKVIKQGFVFPFL